MATVPQEDQDLIDRLNETAKDLLDQEVEAAKNKNETRRLALHHHVQQIQNLIKSIVKYHVDLQNQK